MFCTKSTKLVLTTRAGLFQRPGPCGKCTFKEVVWEGCSAPRAWQQQELEKRSGTDFLSMLDKVIFMRYIKDVLSNTELLIL